MAALPLSQAFGYVVDTRYLSLVGLTIIAYDALLSFPNELYFVWMASTRKTGSIMRVAYAANRYGTLVMSILFASALFPNMTSNASWCADLFTSVIVLYFVTCTCGNSLTLHTLTRVSECSRKVGWMIALGYISMHSITFVFTGIAIKQVRDGITFVSHDGFMTCALSQTPFSFLGAFVPAAALDCYTFALIIMNALSRPRSTSQRLLNMLLKDGMAYFLICLSTRVLNIIMSSAAPTALVFVSWGIGFNLNAAVTARLYLRMCETDFLPNSEYAVPDADHDERSTISSFFDSISDEGEMVTDKS